MDYENDSIIWFKDGKSYDNHILGGKGAGLCMMTQLGLPVPPGFIIPTTVCNEFYKNSKKLPKTLMDDVKIRNHNWQKIWRISKSSISLSQIWSSNIYAWYDGHYPQFRIK